MAYEYQSGEGSFDLSGLKDVLPDELSSRYMQNLDAAMSRSDKMTYDNVTGMAENNGFLRSGNTLKNIATDVLGPAQDRRNALLLPELRNAANVGIEDRRIQGGYQQQKDVLSIEHMNRLDEMQKQSDIQRMLLQLQDSLNGNDKGFDWGALAGQAAGQFAGGIFGNITGAVGQRIGNKIYSGFKPNGGANT